MGKTTKTIQVSIEEIKDLLNQGYSRFAKDDQGFGSIEAYYGFQTAAAVRKLFLHPKLKGLRSKVPDFIIVDDEPTVQEPQTTKQKENKEEKKKKEHHTSN